MSELRSIAVPKVYSDNPSHNLEVVLSHLQQMGTVDLRECLSFSVALNFLEVVLLHLEQVSSIYLRKSFLALDLLEVILLHLQQMCTVDLR